MLRKCTKYSFAVALNNKKIEKEKDNLFVSTGEITTGGTKEPSKPSGVNLVDDDILIWSEDDVEKDSCYSIYSLDERNVCTLSDTKKCRIKYFVEQNFCHF